MYPIGELIDHQYFSVLINGYIPVWVRRKGFVEFYQKEVGKEGHSVRLKIDTKKLEEIFNTPMLSMDFGIDDGAIYRAYGIEPIIRKPVRPLSGEIDTHGDMIMPGSFDKTKRVVSFLPHAHPDWVSGIERT